MSNKQKVLITGASKGIGLAIAKVLDEHYHLILHASKEENLTAQFKNKHSILCADFSDNEQVKDFCKKLKSLHGDELYGIINNAGIALDKPLNFQPENDWDKMMQVNLKTPIMISKTALKIFTLSKKGVIINMSSCVAETGNAFQSVYAATKAGLIAFSKSLAKEVSMLHENHEVRINCVSPGFIETEMTAAIPENYQQNILKMIPSNRFGKTEEVAQLIAFLLSENASYINGSNIAVNGGII